MRKKQRLMAALLAGVLLLSAGCGRSPNSIKDNIVAPTTPATEPTEIISAEASLNSLRQAMVGTSQLFAVAYFGYHYSQNMELPVDPFAVMEEYAPGLCRDLPFLAEIPEDRIIGEGGDLFCIVPLDEDATVAVSRGYWDDENEQYIYDDMLYSSATGEPILLFCNYEGWEPDTQVYISGPSGEVFWCPEADSNGYTSQTQRDLFYDFSPYGELVMAEHRWLKDWGWILPTHDQLIGTTWSWYRYLADGTEQSCEMSIDNDFLAVRWNDGIDAEDHVYQDAAWELTYEDGVAILSIDFREMAGVLHYNLLYHEEYGELYVSIDVMQEDLPIGGEPLSRYMTKTSIPDPIEMVGTWELGWTEVEDDISGAEPGSQIIEITTDYAGLYWISYINNENPSWSYYDKELVVFPFELYNNCGNDQWSATVNHTGFGGTEYSLTLLPEGTLLVRNYWEMEGFRMVAHGWYTRAYNEEDPYTYAISQGWRLPELTELLDSNWLSQLGHAMDLRDDSVPGDDGGWATVYDVDEIGAYTESYSGSWRYEDGMLHLSLVPKFGDGVLVDDSFPVLMLDGQLWIGRNSSGLGLPYFGSDTIADVLIQPKG